MSKQLGLSFALACGVAAPALAEWEISVYTGFQTAPHSGVEGDANGLPFDFTAEWEGRPFEAPPYYGVRVTYWQNAAWGYGVELNHAKVYADDDTLEDNGFDDLEFTDGINLVTLNGYRRWQQEGRRWTPYVGGGLGVAIPHVDVEIGESETFEYQLTGPAVVWLGGVSYTFSDCGDVNGSRHCLCGALFSPRSACAAS